MTTGGAHRSLPELAQDVLLALVVTVLQVQGAISAAENSEVVARPLTDMAPLSYALLTVSGLALIARRRWPVSVFVATALFSLVYFALGYSDGPVWIALFVAIYTLTAYGDGRRSVRIAGTGIAVLATVWLIADADVEPGAAIGWVFFRIVASVMAAALGESVRSRRVIAADAEERAELAERTREEEARSRVDAERLRIAREVHDTVAHAISIVNVQAGVTAYLLEKRPERARETLETIEQTSSRALHEMRAILGVLRDTESERAPQPGLEQIEELVGMARDSGLDINLEVNLPATPLPSAVDGTVYRVVQESITNVIRHVGPARMTIVIDHEPDAVELRMTDEGMGPPPTDGATPDLDTTSAPVGPGNGITGMRERCELLGGELTAGPLPSGGFEVTARLPLAPTQTVLT